jgi:MerR family transcriptional regulator, activator of bmr gene
MNDSWIRNDLTIGEVAGILDISAKMLRYWDEIGLLKPHSINEMNGYRYYSSSQFYLLNFIKYLRKLNVPYDVIKTRLHETDARYLAELLKEQVELTDGRIKELNAIKETFLHHVSDIEEAGKMGELDSVMIKTLPEHAIIIQQSRIASRADFELSIGKLEKLIQGTPTLLVSQVGLLLCRDDMLAGDYSVFCGAFVPQGNYTARERDVRVLPAGEYATIRFWGNISTSDPYYEKLSNFIRDNGYTAVGDMTRKCLAPGVIHEKRAHLAEVSILVHK